MSGILSYFRDTPNEYIAGVSFAIFYISYYLIEVVKKPTLVCKDGYFRQFLEKNITLIHQKFWPTLWCFESRLQTVIASILRTKLLPDVIYRREIFTLSDGGEIALDWMEQGTNEKSPVMIILPGLTGASQADYIKCLVNASRLIGVRCVVFINRGLGGVQLKTPRLYCAANYDDLMEVIVHVKKQHPRVPLTATGISLGGLILGNYLSQHGNRSLIQAAMVISSPLNVPKGSECIERPYLNTLLSYHMAMNLRRTINQCEPLREGPWSLEEVNRSKTVREFDQAFTTKHFGFKDVEAYYRAATLHDKLHDIKVPVLCLMAADDPFQPLETIPIEEAKNTDHVAIIITARGGHIGFMEGLWPNREGHNVYMARLFAQYFKAIHLDPKLLNENNLKDTR